MLSENSILQIIFYLFILLLCVKPLGWYIAQVYEGKTTWLNYLERFFYCCCGINKKQEMDWKQYLLAMLTFNFLGFLVLYLIQRLQILLPLNPQNLASPSSDLAFNTAASFVTNTNWQAYAGETTMSYLTQMLALTTQNFLSAATGMSLVVALARGISRHESKNLGNFWVDTLRGTLYILLPLALIFALSLVSLGVIQNFKPNETIKLIQPITYQLQQKSKTVTEQIIPMGPVASQVAIKQLGSNGGGFFNTNSSHPFENPTPLSNFLEMLALLLIPASLCYTFGLIIKDKRQGWSILTAMYLLIIPFIILALLAEQAGNPALSALGVKSELLANSYPGGNMEGKETRFGIANSALWAVATTASSNGSVNAMLDSFIPSADLRLYG